MSTTMSAGVDDYPCFTTFNCYLLLYLLIVKLQTFPYTGLLAFLVTSTTSKERMTTNIIFVGATPII